MERKKFLRNSIGLLGSGAIIFDACKKTSTIDPVVTDPVTNPTGDGSCVVTPTKEEGPFPYPGGEITNPLDRIDVTGGQTGIPLSITFSVVNTNNNCAVVEGARVDIWHCNKDGYYSGYGGQPGVLGTQSYLGETWLRGYQASDANGLAKFTTIYPGWYGGRATHIHFEVFIDNVLKKQSQMAFSETISDEVHTSSGYHGINPERNATDHVFNNVTDLANETFTLAGNITSGYTGTYTIGLAL